MNVKVTTKYHEKIALNILRESDFLLIDVILMRSNLFNEGYLQYSVDLTNIMMMFKVNKMN